MNKKLSTVKKIVECTGMSEAEKLNLIQSYLLGWTDEDSVVRIVKANNRLTTSQVMQYKESNGSRAAANLLLLAGPDGYVGAIDYDDLLEDLEAEADLEEASL